LGTGALRAAVAGAKAALIRVAGTHALRGR
jgi:hypothetical protein